MKLPTFPSAEKKVNILVNPNPLDDSSESRSETHTLMVTYDGLLRPLEHKDWGKEAEERIEILKAFGGPDACVCQRLTSDSEVFRPVAQEWEWMPEDLHTCAQELCLEASQRMCWLVQVRCNRRVNRDKPATNEQLKEVSTFTEHSTRPQKTHYTKSLLFGSAYHKAMKGIYTHLDKHRQDYAPEMKTQHLILEVAVFPFLSALEGNLIFIDEDGVKIGTAHFGWKFPTFNSSRMWWEDLTEEDKMSVPAMTAAV